MTGVRIAVVTASVLVAAAPAARADDIAAGAVIKIERDEVYVNLGRTRGVGDGAPLRIKRRFAARHPVTRARVSDWIPIGAATVTEAGERMSRAVLGDGISAVKVGDIAEVYVDTPDAPVPAAAPTPAPSDAPRPAVDRATADVLAVFAAQSGATLDARIAAWEAYQASHPGSVYAAAISRDLDELRTLRETLRPDQGGVRGIAPTAVDHHGPTRTRPDADVPLVFVVADPTQIASAWLHYRTAGAPTYQRVLLRREQELYLRGAIPAAAVHGGSVEYFVEVTSPRGDSGIAVGSPSSPRQIAIERPVLAEKFGGERDRTIVTLSASYLDFANLDRRDGDRTDREMLGEIDVRYLLGAHRGAGGVRALGVGYGVFAGKGGEDAVWTAESPAPRTGFNYGYAEAELGAGTRVPVSLAGRFYAGVGRDGFEVGGEVRGRLGPDTGTNLTATVRQLAKIGWLSDLRLETRLRPALPVGVAVGVLDQPAAGDLGVKLGLDVGYAIGPVTPVARVSWQGRSIHHGGVGGGLALAVRW